jgi:peroxiredoxin
MDQKFPSKMFSQKKKKLLHLVNSKEKINSLKGCTAAFTPVCSEKHVTQKSIISRFHPS